MNEIEKHDDESLDDYTIPMEDMEICFDRSGKLSHISIKENSKSMEVIKQRLANPPDQLKAQWAKNLCAHKLGIKLAGFEQG